MDCNDRILNPALGAYLADRSEELSERQQETIKDINDEWARRNESNREFNGMLHMLSSSRRAVYDDQHDMLESMRCS